MHSHLRQRPEMERDLEAQSLFSNRQKTSHRQLSLEKCIWITQALEAVIRRRIAMPNYCGHHHLLGA